MQKAVPASAPQPCVPTLKPPTPHSGCGPASPSVRAAAHLFTAPKERLLLGSWAKSTRMPATRRLRTPSRGSAATPRKHQDSLRCVTIRKPSNLSLGAGPPRLAWTRAQRAVGPVEPTSLGPGAERPVTLLVPVWTLCHEEGSPLLYTPGASEWRMVLATECSPTAFHITAACPPGPL